MKKQYRSPKSFASDFQDDYINSREKINLIDNQIRELEEKKSNIQFPNLRQELYKLAVEIKVAIKADSFEITKQGGLFSNRFSILFKKGKPSKKNIHSNWIGYLSFAEFRGGELGLITNLKTDETLDLESLTMKELVQIAKKQK